MLSLKQSPRLFQLPALACRLATWLRFTKQTKYETQVSCFVGFVLEEGLESYRFSTPYGYFSAQA